MIRLLPIMEMKLDIFKECGLISFDGEMIMRLSPYQVCCELALCEESVGSDSLTFDIYSIKQWCGCFDFVGALGIFIAFGWQGTYFFWV